MPNYKRKQASAPTEPPVPALGLSDEQLQHLSEVVAPKIELKIAALSRVNIPSNQRDSFKPQPGISIPDECRLHVSTSNSHFEH